MMNDKAFNKLSAVPYAVVGAGGMGGMYMVAKFAGKLDEKASPYLHDDPFSFMTMMLGMIFIALCFGLSAYERWTKSDSDHKNVKLPDFVYSGIRFFMALTFTMLGIASLAHGFSSDSSSYSYGAGVLHTAVTGSGLLALGYNGKKLHTNLVEEGRNFRAATGGASELRLL
jgi:hypothetical protein